MLLRCRGQFLEMEWLVGMQRREREGGVPLFAPVMRTVVWAGIVEVCERGSCVIGKEPSE
jgi:hypothetical protein